MIKLFNKLVKRSDTENSQDAHKNKLSNIYKKTPYSYVKDFVYVSKDIIESIPTKDDNYVSMVFKGLAIVETLATLYNKYDASEHRRHLIKEGYVGFNNMQFVYLFHDTEIKNLFQEIKFKYHHPGGKNLQILKYHNDDIGTILFWESAYDGDKLALESTFWYSKDFSFEKMYEHLWKKMNNKINIEAKDTNNNDSVTRNSIKPLPNLIDPLFGEENETLKEFYEQNMRYKRDGLARTYLFYGKQGTGKSTFAIRLSEMFGGKIVKVNANKFTNSSFERGVGFILSKLRPDFLIIDDLDKIEQLSHKVLLLFDILETVRTECPYVSVIFTANDICEFDPALLRPGRIDEIHEFKMPDKAERKALLIGYLKEFNKGDAYQDEVIDELAEQTEGLSHAYIREVALQLKYYDAETVLKTIYNMLMLSREFRQYKTFRVREALAEKKALTEKLAEVKTEIATPDENEEQVMEKAIEHATKVADCVDEMLTSKLEEAKSVGNLLLKQYENNDMVAVNKTLEQLKNITNEFTNKLIEDSGEDDDDDYSEPTDFGDYDDDDDMDDFDDLDD